MLLFKNKQKEFEKAYRELDTLIHNLEFVNNEYRPIWLILLEDLDRKIKIFEWEGDKIKLNKRGFPCVNWGKLLANLPTIIAYIARIIQQTRR